MNDYVKAFAEYTESVITTSNLTFRRGLVKEKADKRQSLRYRWHKHYQSFTSLAEDQSRGTEKSASTLESSDLKIKKNEETQEKTVRRLVSSIFANNSLSSPRSIEDISVDREISIIKADLRELKILSDNTKQNMRKTSKHGAIAEDLEQNLRDLAANSMTKSAMTEYESKIAHLTVNLSVLQNSFNRHETAFAQLPHMQDLIDKLNGLLREFGQSKEQNDDLSSRIDQQNARIDQQNARIDQQNARVDQQNAKTDQQSSQFQVLSEQEEKRYKGLRDDLDVQTKNLQLLNLEVTGNPEEEVKGLIEFITDGGSRIDKTENALKNLDSELESFANDMEQLKSKMLEPSVTAELVSDLDALKERFGNVEANMQLFQEKESKSTFNTVDSFDGKTDLADSNMQVQEKYTALEEKLASIEQQQDEKDDMVSAEVERLEGLLKMQADETKQLQQEILGLRPKTAAPVINQSLHRPSPIGNSPKVEELLLLKIPALETDLKEFREPLLHRTDAIEVLVESLQQRFDNLSTEHMASAIIHQMQTLYPPHPGNVLNEFTQIKNRLGIIDNALYHIWGELAKFHGRIEQITQMTTGLKSEMQENVERRLKDLGVKNGSGDQGFHAIEGRFSNLLQDSQQKSALAEQKFADFTVQSAEGYSKLHKIFEDLKASFSDQSLKLLSVADDMAALRADHATYKSSVNDTLREMGVRLQNGEADILQELPSIHAKIALLNQHTQLNNPTVLAAIAAAQQEEQQEEPEEQQQQQQQRSSVAPNTDPPPPGLQPLNKPTVIPAAAPLPATETLPSPLDKQPPAEVPPSKPSPKDPPQPTTQKALKRTRDSLNKNKDNHDHDDDDPHDTSEDSPPMKVQRRRESSSSHKAASSASASATVTATDRPGI